MALTKLEIYNLALGHIGQITTIGSENENSTERRLCDRFYTNAREECLADFDWPFARAFTTLSLTTSANPPVGYTYEYNYPASCFRTRYIMGTTRAWIDRVPFEVAWNGTAKVILTDRQSAELAFTRDVTSESEFDPQFTTALSFKLSSRLAVPIAQDGNIATLMMQQYMQTMQNARNSTLDERVGEPNRNPQSTNDISEARFA